MMQSKTGQQMNRSVQQSCNGQNHGIQARGVQSRNVQNQGGFVPSSCTPCQYTRTSTVQQGCPGAAHSQNCKEMNVSEPKSSGLSKQQLMKRVTLCGFACTDAVLYWIHIRMMQRRSLILKNTIACIRKQLRNIPGFAAPLLCPMPGIAGITGTG